MHDSLSLISIWIILMSECRLIYIMDSDAELMDLALILADITNTHTCLVCVHCTPNSIIHTHVHGVILCVGRCPAQSDCFHHGGCHDAHLQTGVLAHGPACASVDHCSARLPAHHRDWVCSLWRPKREAQACGWHHIWLDWRHGGPVQGQVHG